MTTAAHNLSDLVDRGAARRRGVGQLHRLFELSSDDEFADQKLAALCARDPDLDLRLREMWGSPIHDDEPVGIRNAIEQYGFRVLYSGAVVGSFSTAVGGPKEAGRQQETWRWLMATVTLSVGISELRGLNSDRAVAALMTAHLGRLLLEADAPDLLTDAAALAQERGTTLAAAQQEVAGFSEFELGARLAEHWELPTDLASLAGEGDRRSELGRLVDRSIEAAAGYGYHDPLAPIRSSPPTVSPDVEALLEPRGGEEWVQFAVHALLLACKGA